MPAAPRPELKTRHCDACGAAYDYPLPDSVATRFHCESCAPLPEAVRKALKKLNVRIAKLEKQLASKG